MKCEGDTAKSCFSPVSAEGNVSLRHSSVATAGFWPWIGISQGGNPWDMVLLEPLPSQRGSDVSPTQLRMESLLAVSLCRDAGSSRDPIPPGYCGTGASVEAMSSLEALLDGQREPNLHISCSQSCIHLPVIWAKAGWGGLRRPCRGVEEYQTKTSEGSMGVLTNPNFQALLIGKPGFSRVDGWKFWRFPDVWESCCSCSSPASQHLEADVPLL